MRITWTASALVIFTKCHLHHKMSGSTFFIQTDCGLIINYILFIIKMREKERKCPIWQPNNQSNPLYVILFGHKTHSKTPNWEYFAWHLSPNRLGIRILLPFGEIYCMTPMLFVCFTTYTGVDIFNLLRLYESQGYYLVPKFNHQRISKECHRRPHKGDHMLLPSFVPHYYDPTYLNHHPIQSNQPSMYSNYQENFYYLHSLSFDRINNNPHQYHHHVIIST